MNIIKMILDKPVKAELETVLFEHEEIVVRAKNIYWRNKKYCGRILQRFI